MQTTTSNVKMTPPLQTMIDTVEQGVQESHALIMGSQCHVSYHSGFDDFEVRITAHLEHTTLNIIRTDLELDIALEDALMALRYKLDKYKAKQQMKTTITELFRGGVQRLLWQRRLDS